MELHFRQQTPPPKLSPQIKPPKSSPPNQAPQIKPPKLSKWVENKPLCCNITLDTWYSKSSCLLFLNAKSGVACLILMYLIILSLFASHVSFCSSCIFLLLMYLASHVSSCFSCIYFLACSLLMYILILSLFTSQVSSCFSCILLLRYILLLSPFASYVHTYP